jgi:hypothetical protein
MYNVISNFQAMAFIERAVIGEFELEDWKCSAVIAVVSILRPG